MLRSVMGADATATELLLALVLVMSRTNMIAHSELKLTAVQTKEFHKLLRRYRKGEPLAYLLGRQPFYALDFEVNKHTLVPRPETEWLVEQAVQLLRKNPGIHSVVDVGTGSGCIIISVWNSLTVPQRARLKWFATDISQAALNMAKGNAQRLKTNTIKFVKDDLIKKTGAHLVGSTLILANLPYLPQKDYQNASVSVRKFEPKSALEAGIDGLRYYRQLILQMKKLPTQSWQSLWEIDPCHSKKLKGLLKKNFHS